ncbi:MAG TPA: hypothetical protein VFT50_09340 [Baekduia sp.]|nr:hypothetical protein [Baekduia sp.]
MAADAIAATPEAPADGFQPIGLAEARKRYDQAKNARRVYEADWFLNVAFYQGEQWVAYNGDGLYRPKVRSRVTITDNRIQPTVRTEVARLTKQRPGYSATPRGLDDQAVNDAQSSTRLLDWAYDHLSFAYHRREAVEWSRLASAGFVKTTWDANAMAGVDVLVDAAGKPVPHPNHGGPIRAGEVPEIEQIEGVSTKRIGGGDVRYDTRSAFDIFPDPLATSMHDLRWLIDESVKSPEYVFETYGARVEPDAPPQVGIVESRFTSRGVDAARGEKVGVRIFELWEKPSKLNPQGRHLVWTAERVLVEEPNPYGRIPYTMFPGVPVPGRFWPDSVVTHLRPIQARLNKLLSQVAENAARFGNPSIMLDKLSGIKYSGVPGEQLWHNAQTQVQLPQFLQPPTMPSYVFNLMDYAQNALREISGQYEVSQGSVPSGVTAASAISLLQEQDATRLGPDVEAMELAIADVGQQSLELMARYYTTERIVVIVGDDQVVDVDTFRADATFSIPTVSVVPFSTFPRSLAAKQAAIRDILNMFFQYGVPVDASALAAVLKDMQVGGLEKLVSGYTADVTQVAREHVDLVRGRDLLVNEFDNHAVHLQGHKDFAKSPRFRTLPDDQQAALIDHIRLHEQLAAAQAPQVVNPGGPPPPPGGTPSQVAPGTVPTYPSGNPMPAAAPPLPQAA